ncbi:ComF family protein [Candidatus Gracilibacteria bacterium]|nr:ComF family protein [Candidatus Gracilibacteria bacterium]
MGTFFDYLFPPKCCVCECTGAHLCEYCRYDLVESFLTDDGVMLKSPYASISAAKFFAITACRPTPVLRQALHAFKYTHTEELTEIFGEILVTRLKGFRFSRDVCIVPVPLHASRVRERGFNQSLLLARYVAKRLRLKVADILERTRCTFPQAQLSRSDRILNVRGAFALKANVTKLPRVVLLLDDVITTGSTFTSCRDVLIRAGATKVYGLALAHGL